MSETNYTTLKLPRTFVETHVDPFVDEKSAGFSSRAEVVKTAIREYVKTKQLEANIKCPVPEVAP